MTHLKKDWPQNAKASLIGRSRVRIQSALLDRSYWWAAGAGLIGWLVWEPLAWGWLAPLAPAFCFLIARRAATPGQAMRRTLVFCSMFYFAALHWLCTVSKFGFAPAPAVFGGIFMLGVYTAFYPALGIYLLRRWAWPRCAVLQFFGFCGVWLIAEWLRTLGRLAMPLGQLGHAWAPYPRMIQVASELGELGVSLESLWAAGILLIIIKILGVRFDSATAPATAQASRGSLRLAAVAYVLLPAALFFAPHWRAVSGAPGAQPAAASTPLRVGVIQPNVDQMTKLASYAYPDRKIQARLQDTIMTSQALLIASLGAGNVDLLVLPETSFTQNDFMAQEDARARAVAMATGARADMLFSADRIVDTPQEFTVFNTAYMLNTAGDFTDFYDKMRLVPFGEAMPYFDKIPGIKALVDIGTFGEGTRATLFETHGHKFGTMICFESTFSQMGRMYANAGADFLAVITNDAWYGLSAGPAMHYRLSLLRAVETRRWVVRSANTGISAIIDPQGRPVQRLDLGQPGTLQATIDLPTAGTAPTTLFMRFGNSWLWIVAIGLAGLWISKRRIKNG